MAAIILAMSSSSSAARRIRSKSIPPMLDTERDKSWSLLISIEKTNTFLPESATFSAIFMPREVFPIEGLAAMIIKSDGHRPESLLSSSSNPVARPVRPPPRSIAACRLSIHAGSISRTVCAPPWLRLSDIAAIIVAALSSFSPASPCSRASTLRSSAAISIFRSIALSRTIAAYCRTFAAVPTLRARLTTYAQSSIATASAIVTGSNGWPFFDIAAMPMKIVR